MWNMAMPTSDGSLSDVEDRVLRSPWTCWCSYNRRRRRSVGWMLRTQERANEGRVSVVMAGGCSSPFYSGRGGAHRDEGGGNSRR
jgi:hypothetical protein